jgi:hypothetical protein
MSAITLTIPSWAVWTLLSLYVYYQLWSKADSFVYATVGGAVRARDVRIVFLENVGMALRLIRRQPTYGLEQGPQLVFGFDARHAFPRDAQMACWRVVAQVRRERWTYPASQRNCVDTLASQLVRQAREYEAFIERGEKLRAAYEKHVKTGQVVA